MKTKTLPFTWFNNKITPLAEAVVPIETAALQYGIGAFGGIRGYKQADDSIGIFRLQDHVKRMKNSAKLLQFPLQIDENELSEIITSLIKKNAPAADIYIRPFIFRSDTGLGPGLEGEFQLAVYMLELGNYLPTDEGISLGTSSWRRIPDETLPARAKASGGYINASLAIEEAKRHGYDQALMLDTQGNVAEGAVMNLFVVHDGTLLTPSGSSDLLEGITRRTILEIAKEEGIPCFQAGLKRSHIYQSDEMFVCGTAAQVSWVESVDDRQISSEIGPITQKLQRRFQAITRGEDTLSKKYLTIIKL